MKKRSNYNLSVLLFCVLYQLEYWKKVLTFVNCHRVIWTSSQRGRTNRFRVRNFVIFGDYFLKLVKKLSQTINVSKQHKKYTQEDNLLIPNAFVYEQILYCLFSVFRFDIFRIFINQLNKFFTCEFTSRWKKGIWEMHTFNWEQVRRKFYVWIK